MPETEEAMPGTSPIEIVVETSERIIENLKLKALEGNLGAIKQNYLTYIDSITDDFYETLINHLTLTKKWGDSQQGLLNILDYLNEVDPKYKAFILRASKENQYKLSAKAIERLKEDPSSEAFFKNCQVSLLFRIFAENKLPLFIKLLQHGAYAQTWGLQASDDPYPLENLFYSIIHYGSYENSSYLEYLKALMPSISDPNQTLTPEALTKANTFKEQGSALGSNVNPVAMNGFLFPITRLCSEPDTKGLELILPKAHLSHIAFQIIYLSQIFRLRVQLAYDYKITFHSTEGEVNNASQRISLLTRTLPPAKHKYMAYIFCPVIYNDNTVLCRYKMSLLTQEASARLKTLSLEAVSAEYEALFLMAKQKRTESQYWPLIMQEKHPTSYAYYKNETFYMLLACEYLLMTYAKGFPMSPTPEQAKFLKERAIPLYNEIIAVLEERPDIPSREILLGLYKQIKDSFEAPQLEDTPPPVIMHPQAPSSSKAPSSQTPTNSPQAESTYEHKGFK